MCSGDQAAALTALSEAIAIYQRIGAAEAGTATAYLATLEDELREDTPLSNRPYCYMITGRHPDRADAAQRLSEKTLQSRRF